MWGKGWGENESETERHPNTQDLEGKGELDFFPSFV